MAAISVGGAFGEGFSLIQRKPLTVLLWGLVYIGGLGTSISLVAPGYVALMGAMMHGVQAGVTTPPDMTAMMPLMMQMQLINLVVNLLILFMSAVLYCAVFRAVLHPERSQFGYLRIGAAELYVVVLIFGANFALGLGLVVAIIPFAIVIGVLVGTHAYMAALIVGIAGVIMLFAGLIYVALRFSMVGPMIVDDGKFHLGESWTLTKGRVGSLFLIALLLLLVLLAAEIVVEIVLVAIGAGGLGLIAGGFVNLQAFFQQPPEAILMRLAPLIIVFAVILIPLAGCALAIAGAPWARAYRDLKPPDLASTFA